MVSDEKLKKKKRKKSSSPSPKSVRTVVSNPVYLQNHFRHHSIEAFERLYIQVIWKIVENLSNGGYLPLDLVRGVIKDFVPCLNY